MYHSVANTDDTDLQPYYRTVTRPELFSEHMAMLHREGYSAIGLPDAVKLLKQGALASNTVVITFDDGYRDFYQNAFPVLQQYSFTATMYLPTAFIGDHNLVFKGRECMNWTEVRELAQAGISFSSHTVSHPKLYELSSRRIREEITVSKATIEDKLGCRAESFAYPYAFPDVDRKFKHELRNMLLEAGYTCGVTTTIGLAQPDSDPIFIERLPVNSCDDQQLFSAKLRGSYDWIRKPQHLVKLAKSWGNPKAAHKVSY